MMLRVAWDAAWDRGKYVYGKKGTITGYVYGSTNTYAIVLRDPNPPNHNRGLERVRIELCYPIGWRREIEIT